MHFKILRYKTIMDVDVKCKTKLLILFVYQFI